MHKISCQILTTRFIGNRFGPVTATLVQQCEKSRTGSKASKFVLTSSSAVAERPHDASYMSVVSFNSTKRRAQSFIVSYIGYTDLSLRTIKSVLLSSV